MKNWKKRKGSNIWINKNSNNLKNYAHEIWVFEYHIDKNTLRYDFILNNKKIKTFKTKPKAIAYAKKYMRIH